MVRYKNMIKDRESLKDSIMSYLDGSVEVERQFPVNKYYMPEADMILFKYSLRSSSLEDLFKYILDEIRWYLIDDFDLNKSYDYLECDRMNAKILYCSYANAVELYLDLIEENIEENKFIEILNIDFDDKDLEVLSVVQKWLLKNEDIKRVYNALLIVNL